MPSITSRSYAGPEDLETLRELAGAGLAARAPLHGYWHPGDVTWMLSTHADKGLWDATRDIRLWVDERGCGVALAWFYAFFHARFDVRPGQPTSLIDEVVAWCEEHRRRLGPPGEAATLSTHAHDHDQARVAALVRRGYAPLAREVEETLTLDLGQALPSPSLPAGLRLRDCTAIELEERAACHRDAWSNLAHIGRPDQKSDFTTEKYRGLRAAPGYDPELDLVVEADGGTHASCCIAWSDAKSGVGIFEPVGTRPRYRGLGLTAAMIAEGCRRLRDKGMRAAHMAANVDNNPTAAAAYLKSFVHDGGHLRLYLKRDV